VGLPVEISVILSIYVTLIYQEIEFTNTH